MDPFYPDIVMFSCQNCPTQARNRLIALKRQDPYGGIRRIFLPCLSRLDIMDILRVIEEGADAVFVVGCSENSCLFKDGFDLAERRVNYVKKILGQIGLEEERVQIIQASSSRALQFASIIKEQTNAIRQLGPISA